MPKNKDLMQPLVGDDDQPHAYIEMSAPGQSQPAATTAQAAPARPAADWLRPWPLTAVVLFLVNAALIVGVTILGTELADRSQCVSYPAPNAQNELVSKMFKQGLPYLPPEEAGNYEVVNGQLALEKDQLYFLVPLFGEASCTASLIASQWVLTAAHCLHRYELQLRVKVEDFEAGIGIHNKNQIKNTKCSKKIPAARIYNHPSYDSETYENDIALIYLSEPVECQDRNKVRYVELNEEKSIPEEGKELEIAGWGNRAISGEADDYPDELHKGVVYAKNCTGWSDGRINDKLMVCASGNDASHRKDTVTDTCQGDSGGPLYYKSGGEKVVQVGITSFGTDCGSAQVTAVYTRVSAYDHWLKEVKETNEKVLELSGIADHQTRADTLVAKGTEEALRILQSMKREEIAIILNHLTPEQNEMYRTKLAHGTGLHRLLGALAVELKGKGGASDQAKFLNEEEPHVAWFTMLQLFGFERNHLMRYMSTDRINEMVQKGTPEPYTLWKAIAEQLNDKVDELFNPEGLRERIWSALNFSGQPHDQTTNLVKGMVLFEMSKLYEPNALAMQQLWNKEPDKEQVLKEMADVFRTRIEKYIPNLLATVKKHIPKP